MAKTELKITLRLTNSPVKYTGKVVESCSDGTRIKVEFDGPMEDRTLYAFGSGTKLYSDMIGHDGKPVEEFLLSATSLEWEVL